MILIIAATASFLCSVYYFLKTIVYVLTGTPGARSVCFYNTIFCLFLAVFFFILSPHIRHRWLILQKKMPLNIFICLSIVITAVKWILFKNHNPLDWPRSQDLVLLLRYEDPNYLVNDFIVNAGMRSPRCALPILLYPFIRMGISLYNVVLWSKLCVVFCIAPSIVRFAVVVANRIKNIEKPFYVPCWIGVLISIFVVSDTVGYFSDWVFGWPMVESFQFSGNMGIAFILIFEYFILIDGRTHSLQAYFLLPLITFIHPAMAVFALGIEFILIRMIKHSESTSPLYWVLRILLLLGVVLIFKCQFKAQFPLSSKEFVRYYALNEQHKIHYQMSFILRWLKVLGWCFFIPGVLLFISIKLKQRMVLRLVVCMVLMQILSIVAQYVFSELIPVRAIVELGPSRFVVFWTPAVALSFVLLCYSQHFLQKKSIDTSIEKRLHWFFLERGSAPWITLIVMCFFAISLTGKNDFSEHFSENEKKILVWIRDHVESSSVIAFASEISYEKHPLSYAIRIYSKRALYEDGWSWPFNDDFILEHLHRQSVNESLEKQSCEQWHQTARVEKFQYVLVRSGVARHSDCSPVMSFGDLHLFKVL